MRPQWIQDTCRQSAWNNRVDAEPRKNDCRDQAEYHILWSTQHISNITLRHIETQEELGNGEPRIFSDHQRFGVDIGHTVTLQVDYFVPI